MITPAMVGARSSRAEVVSASESTRTERHTAKPRPQPVEFDRGAAQAARQDCDLNCEAPQSTEMHFAKRGRQPGVSYSGAAQAARQDSDLYCGSPQSTRQGKRLHALVEAFAPFRYPLLQPATSVESWRRSAANTQLRTLARISHRRQVASHCRNSANPPWKL